MGLTRADEELGGPHEDGGSIAFTGGQTRGCRSELADPYEQELEAALEDHLCELCLEERRANERSQGTTLHLARAGGSRTAQGQTPPLEPMPTSEGTSDDAFAPPERKS